MSRNHEPWTPSDLDILRREFPGRPTEEVARMLARTERGVSVKAARLGLKKMRYGLVWTPPMLTLLRALYPITFNRPLAATLGVSPSALIRKARELGIEKAPGFLERRRQCIKDLAAEGVRRAYREGKITTTFKPGCHANPEGEFKPGQKQSPEVKAKRVASYKRTVSERKRLAAMLKTNGIEQKNDYPSPDSVG